MTDSDPHVGEIVTPPADPDRRPWWESSGFRSLVVTLYGIWLVPLYKWAESRWGVEYAVPITGSVTAILSALGFVKVAAQAEARGRAQQARTNRRA